MNVFIPSFKDIKQHINPDYVYEPMTKEEILKEQDTSVGGWLGERNGMYGKTTSEKQKKAVSKAAKKHKPWLKIKNRSGKVMKGKENPKARSVVVNEKEYDTMKAASISLDIPSSTISWRVRSKSFSNYSYK